MGAIDGIIMFIKLMISCVSYGSTKGVEMNNLCILFSADFKVWHFLLCWYIPSGYS